MPPSRTTRLLSIVFFFSGAASLIYQVVWQRLLTVHYGVGAVSSTLIVTVYMLGLGLGALAGGVLAVRIERRLQFYLTLELALGLFGLTSLRLLAFIGERTAGSDYSLALCWMLLFLCVPTMLMGMTLPLLVQVFSGLVSDFQRSVSFLYFINTLGAALGAVTASYGLISFFGLDMAVSVASALNFALAGLIALAVRELPPAPATSPEVEATESLGRLVLPAVFVTGFLALGYEILWIRVIGVLIKDSPYAFSSTLAVYLVGVACGSFGMDRLLRSRPAAGRRDLFLSLQVALALYVIASTCGFLLLTRLTSLGRIAQASFQADVHPTLRGLGALWSFADVFLWPAAFLLVPTLAMGATFPLLSLLSGSHEGREGRIVGNLYFWNIAGNAAGGLATGFLLLPHLGTERTLLVFSGLGLLFLLPCRQFLTVPLAPRARIAVAATALFAAVALLPAPGGLFRAMHVPPGPDHRVYFSEGVEGVVLTYVDGERVRNYIGGQAHGGRPGHTFYYEAIEALSFVPRPREILVIGYGTGSTVEIALRTPGVERVHLVELNGTLMRNLQQIPLFQRLLDDPRLTTTIDDGRRFLLRTDETFDAILIDPLRTATAYSGNLYSKEFFTLARKHIAPGGVLLAWLDEQRILPATLAAAFPNVRKYRFFALAATDPFGPRDEARRTAVLDTFRPRDRAAIERLSDSYEGDVLPARLDTRGGRVNEDLHPVTEYYLGYQVRELLGR